MPTMILDPELAERLKTERALSGADRYDEAWEGTYIMSPLANNEHQLLVSKLTSILELIIGAERLGQVYAGVNISDRLENWEHNFRCPDVAVFLTSTTAVDRRTFWHGGPDLAVEIVSSGDQSHEKIEFYAKVKTQELLIIDRAPWRLELYRLTNGKLEMVASHDITDSAPLTSIKTGLTLELQADQLNDRPAIVVKHDESDRNWSI